MSMIKANYYNINKVDRDIFLLGSLDRLGRGDELALGRISYFRDYRPREYQSASRLVDRSADWVPE